jgi:hypothetical protein
MRTLVDAPWWCALDAGMNQMRSPPTMILAGP